MIRGGAEPRPGSNDDRVGVAAPPSAAADDADVRLLVRADRSTSWVASPPDAGDGPLPTVVNVHGGPLGAWAPAPHIEVSLLVARGYRVLLPNIRGSTTYGRDWIRPQLGDWGGVDASDVHAAARPRDRHSGWPTRIASGSSG